MHSLRKIGHFLPQKRYRAGNGVTITENPGAKLAAGPLRQIPIYGFLNSASGMIISSPGLQRAWPHDRRPDEPSDGKPPAC